MEASQKLVMQEEYLEHSFEDVKDGLEELKLDKRSRSESRADEIYDEIEALHIMSKSEDLKCNEDILCIWGFKMPHDPIEANKVIHHCLLQTNSLAAKGKFRIVYFHSDVKGKGFKIPKMIKKICSKMSKDMRSNLTSFDIIHGNFALKWALFFFKEFSFTDYKIHFRDNMEAFYEDIDIEQKTFVLNVLPIEIRLYDSQRPNSGSSIVGDKKLFKKDIVSKSDSKYVNFDSSTAVQTHQILGKHISEFPREEGETVPEIFTLIFNYFEANEENLKWEGLFRLAGNKELLGKIEENMYKGNYGYLATVKDPLTVGVFLKKVLREMGEPLWTFEHYSQFKDINDEKWSCTEEKIDLAYEIIESMPELYRETFKALLNFLHNVTTYEQYNKMKANSLAIVFSPNLFKPFEVTHNDMIYAPVLVKTLTLMIQHCRD